MSFFEDIRASAKITAATPGDVFQAVVSHFMEQLMFREFIFSRNKFTPAKGPEREFSDFLIFLDGIMIVVELKARDPKLAKHKDDRKWLGGQIAAAKKQHKNTLEYWNEYKNIFIVNHRGDTIDIKAQPVSQVIRVIAYLPGDQDNQFLRFGIRHYDSEKVGFLHILHADDLLGDFLSLQTPYEIIRYFIFREKLIRQWANVIKTECITESWMIAQFMQYERTNIFELPKNLDRPSSSFIDVEKHIQMLNDDTKILVRVKDYFDTLGESPRRLSEKDSELSHYRVLDAFAKLHRTELKAFDEIMSSLGKHVSTDDFNSTEQYATRFFWNFRTKTFYLFFGMSDFSDRHRLRFCFNRLCRGYKYFLGKSKSPLTKLVGLMVVRDRPGAESMICYIDNEWVFDQSYEDDLPFLKIGDKMKDVKATPYYSL